MGETSIQWTDATWNPVRGCSRVSEGCGGASGGGCYAERQAHRFSGPGGPYEGLTRLTKHGPRWTGEVRLVPDVLDQPLRWKQPRRIFVNSMSDLFHEKLANADIDRVFAVMLLAPQHTFQVLTKRPERMRAYLNDPNLYGRVLLIADEMRATRLELSRVAISNPTTFPARWIWLGVSVENQATADERIRHLLATPAAVRFLSCEPLLEHVDLGRYYLQTALGTRSYPFPMLEKEHRTTWLHMLDWVIVGGESGPGSRRFHASWARSLVEQCRAASVACFVKQMGAVVVDRNDAGFDADLETPPEPGAWPSTLEVEHDINGYREDHQGALVRIRLKDRKGGDMAEWPHELRVREFPEVSSG